MVDDAEVTCMFRTCMSQMVLKVKLIFELNQQNAGQRMFIHPSNNMLSIQMNEHEKLSQSETRQNSQSKTTAFVAFQVRDSSSPIDRLV